MMGTDPRREYCHPDRGAARYPGRPSIRDTAACGGIRSWPPLIAELLTVVLCGLSAVLLLVLVARQSWPVWWLVIAGMLIAWAGDALWTLGDHLAAAAAARRLASTRPAEPPASRAGEPR